MKRTSLLLLANAALWMAGTAVAESNTFIHQRTLNDPNPELENRFGKSVAISGMRLVVGARYDNAGAFDEGRAYVYDVAAAAPSVPVATFINPSPETNDYFGWSVSISGTRVVVGASGDDTGAPNAGSAYVYDIASGSLPVATLHNPSPGQNDFFGRSVSISGTRVVVGAYNDSGSGRVFVYDLASATPTAPVVTLNNPRQSLGDFFGFSVAISGTRLVVGALATGALTAGNAYVYDLAGATLPVPVRRLTNPNPSVSDGFGNSVAIFGTRVVVGAFLADAGATNSGSAYVYDIGGATPALPIASLTNPNPTVDGRFGNSVAISGARVVVGAASSDIGATNSGCAYLYDLTSATISLSVATLNNPNPAADALFGDSVAIDGETVVAGAPNVNTTGSPSGAAFIFGLLRPTLSIVRAAPGFATISWTPSDAPGLVLQYSEGLSSPNWTNAPSGALNPVTVRVTNASRFYRLATP